MELQGGAQREGLVTAVADEPVELADAATEVGLTPDLSESQRAITAPTGSGLNLLSDRQQQLRIPARCERTSCRRSR